MPRPFGQAHGEAEMGYLAAVATVGALLLASGPLTITGLIVPIVVDAFDGPTQLRRAHIVKEVGEISPTLTDLNSTASVIIPIAVFGIGAALNHLGPDVVCSPLGMLAVALGLLGAAVFVIAFHGEAYTMLPIRSSTRHARVKVEVVKSIVNVSPLAKVTSEP